MEIMQLDALRAQLRRRDLSVDQRREIGLRIGRLELQPQIDADRDWRAKARDETSHLASVRGETVQRHTTGRIDIRSRDSLRNLAVSGELSQRLYGVGVLIRDMYEARTSDLGSQLGAVDAPRKPHDNDRFVWRRLKKAQALQHVQTLERRIALEDHLSLTILRVVCGERKTLRSQGGGRALERNAARLIKALEIADRYLTAESVIPPDSDDLED